jgi:hypothetical protein
MEHLMNTAPLKADQQAAERLLKAAVREAVRLARRPGPFTYEAIVETLATATTAAALLLDERPAKKAAARKGAS